MSKVYIYSLIIYDIALFQTLKRNYAVNGHEICIARAYSFTCALLTYWHVQSQSYQTIKGVMTKCNGFYIIILLYSIYIVMQMTFSYDSTMTTKDLNMP